MRRSQKTFAKVILSVWFIFYSQGIFAADLALRPAWQPTVPGVTNPDITPGNIKINICKRGWSTKSIRPPAAYTDKLKKKQMKAGRLPGKAADYEEDHLISLEIGGHPRDPRNLWPEAYAGKCGAKVKDKIENKLHSLVCAGKLGLRAAQHAIATDWVGAYRKHVGKLDCAK